MKIEIGEIEIIAEHRPTPPRSFPPETTRDMSAEDIRREIRTTCEALIREEFRRRSEQ